ncbi:HNH endonuclease [Flectobacillus rivi]|uniref:HNH endonuclease n=1 Tax=Flectobacillus rivi TaxID=2984209 RepID=A0ABT6Z8V8_9BACT|nr:HNH endonuclease [Flectobacillus rivi]MDI9877031.1 HNH endonuclease [Flectobacillus rivi]
MRPINKGTWPTKNNSTKKKVFNDWTKAISILKQRTGLYCHLCEMKMNSGFAIEHIKPQESYPQLKSHWSNFLLICPYCNSHKLATIPKKYKENYFWPHLNNTLLVFDYEQIFPHIKPSDSLTRIQKKRANNLIELYGLRKEATSDGSADTRWIEKLKAYKMAIDRRLEYQSGMNQSVNAIVDLAVQSGFFSIWLKVFEDIPLIRTDLIQRKEFHLLNTNCFDNTLQLQPRTTNDL